MSVEKVSAGAYFLLTAYCASMHGMPCSALNECFGSDPSDVPSDQRPSPGPDGSSSRCSRTDPGGPDRAGAEPVQSQPGAHLPSGVGGGGGGGGGGGPVVEYSLSDLRCESLTSARSAHRPLRRSGSEHSHRRPTGEGEAFGTPRNSTVSWSSEEGLPGDVGPLMAPRYPLIPRPSIIIRQPGVSLQNTQQHNGFMSTTNGDEKGEYALGALMFKFYYCYFHFGV